MRELTDVDRIERLMSRLGRESRASGRIYLTGGATAVLMGWRPTTIDVDLKLDGEAESILKAIAHIKEELRVNVELASPADFIPELPGWRERGLFIARHGLIDFFHYDPYSQALSKIERNHLLDEKDVRCMLERGLVERKLLRELFDRIEPELYRFPAIDAPSFRRRVEQTLTD